MYTKKAHIHFVGIGGIGMSGIAKILKHQGYTISGCDSDLDQQSIKDLKSLGCAIFEGNNTPSCHDATIDVLVYSSVIRPHNPEIIAAQQRGIATIPRALMLAELMRTKYSIAIAGAHGKTTTTSLISHILIETGIDPTVIIGGHLKNISTNARLGSGDFLVAETDESDRSVGQMIATLAVITNIDLEHLETYKDLDDIKATFKQFLNNIPFYGKAILCIDNIHVQSLLPQLPHIKKICYGLEPHADIYAQNIVLARDHCQFNVYTKNNAQLLGSIILHMPGRHNVLNALASIATTLDIGLEFDKIAAALASFKGIERRFSFKGTFKGAEVFDDYGHHPQEIYNTLLVARKRAKRKLTVLFQPHRYTRTDKLWNDFIQTFITSGIDHLVITDIHSASEAPIAQITSQNLVKAIAECNPPFKVTYVPLESDFGAIKKELQSVLQEDDLLLLLGAGKVNKFAEKMN